MVRGVAVSMAATSGDLFYLVRVSGYDFDLSSRIAVKHEAGVSDHDDHVVAGAFFIKHVNKRAGGKAHVVKAGLCAAVAEKANDLHVFVS